MGNIGQTLGKMGQRCPKLQLCQYGQKKMCYAALLANIVPTNPPSVLDGVQ